MGFLEITLWLILEIYKFFKLLFLLNSIQIFSKKKESENMKMPPPFIIKKTFKVDANNNNNNKSTSLIISIELFEFKCEIKYL